MKPYVITRAQVKTYLGITDITYDAQIDTWIPVVSDFLVGENGYLNCSFLLEGVADTNSSNLLTEVSGIDLSTVYEGSVVDIESIPDGSTVVSKTTDTITLDNVATSTLADQTLLIRNFPIGYKDIVANLVWYKIGNQTTAKAATGTVKSEKIEDYSITFDDTWSKKGQGGYPKALLDGLDAIKKPRFY
jgi:hypothetical protein